MRQKITRQIFSLILIFVCVLNMGIIVLAEEEYDSGMTREEVIEKYSVHTGNKQADAVFNKYLEKASDFVVDEKYENVRRAFGDEDLGTYYKEYFITYAGVTEEEWGKMTIFERMFSFYLYVMPLHYLMEYSYDSAFATLEIYLDKVCGDIYEGFQYYDTELAEAYYEIMEWQYYYITENHAVYNFMTGEDSLGNTKIEEIEEVKITEENSLGDTLKEKISEVKQEIEEEDAKEEEDIRETKDEDEDAIEEEEEKGIWDDTIESLKDMWLTFVILGVLVVALVAFVIYRKSIGIDDDKMV